MEKTETVKGEMETIEEARDRTDIEREKDFYGSTGVQSQRRTGTGV